MVGALPPVDKEWMVGKNSATINAVNLIDACIAVYGSTEALELRRAALKEGRISYTTYQSIQSILNTPI